MSAHEQLVEEGRGSPLQPPDDEGAPRDAQRVREKKLFLLRVCLAEMLCTFIFLFSVMAMSINSKQLGLASTAVESAIVTGFVAVALVYSFGDVSGAHFNPAVTFATMIVGKTTWRKGLLYILVQSIASIAATVWIGILYGFDQIESLVVMPVSGYLRAFLMETTLTFILCFVVFSTAFGESATPTAQHLAASQGHKGYTIYTINAGSKSGFAGIAIGFTLGFLTMIGGAVSGGAFNPARAFGPAVCSLQIFSLWSMWLYWVGDFAGAAAAAILQKMFTTMMKFETESCSCAALGTACLPGFIARRLL